MKVKIYSIYDSKAESYAKPIFADRVGEVIRSFGDIANDKSHPIGKHPEDYSLYEIGEWDDDAGTVENTTPHKSLGKALDFVKNTLAPSGNENE